MMSAFMMHNQFMNIWSHWIASLLMFASLAYYIVNPLHGASQLDLAVFYMYIIGAAICFAVSGVYHSLLSFRRNGLPVYARAVDFCGTSLLGFATSISGIYFLLTCNQTLKLVFLSIASCIYVAQWIYPWVAPNFYRLNDLVTDIFYAVTTVVSISLLLTSYCMNSMTFFDNSGPGYFISAVLCLIVAFIPFAFMVPERFSPGSFDLFGHGHQIWHLFTAISAFLFEGFLVRVIQARNMTACNA